MTILQTLKLGSLYAVLGLWTFQAFSLDETAPCQATIDYASDLSEELSELEASSPHLERLARGEKIELSTSADFLFSVDLDDENAVHEKLKSLQAGLIGDQSLPDRPIGFDENCLEDPSSFVATEEKVRVLKKKVNQYKVTYFAMPASKRSRLLSKIETEGEFESKSDEVGEQLEQSEKAKKNIETAKNKAQELVDTASSTDEKALARAFVELETYREKVASISVSSLAELKSILDKYDAISKKLSEIESTLSSSPSMSEEQLLILFSKAKTQWRTLIDDGFVVYHMVVDPTEIDAIPDTPEKVLAQATDSERSHYDETKKKATAERGALVAAQRSKIEDRFDDFYHLLLRASKIRSAILSQLEQSGISLLEANQDYLDDVFREILAIPFRFFGIGYARYMHVKSSTSRGLLGLWELLQNILAIVLIFCVPFAARYTNRKVRTVLDSYRSNLLRKRLRTDKISLQIAIWIQRLTPYVPLILYGLLLLFVQNQIANTILEEIGIVIPILGYVVSYKIFRLLVADAFSSLRNIAKVNHRDTRQLIDSTSKLVGFFFLFSYIFLYLTEVTVDEGLLYRQVADMMKGIGLIVCAYAAYRWSEYVAPAARACLPEKIGTFFEKKCSGSWAIFFCLPTLLIIIATLIADSVWQRISDLEVSKKFLAKLYRKKVESFTNESSPTSTHELPEAYTKLFAGNDFSDDSLIVNANEKAFEKVKSEIESWLKSEEEDQSVAIHGEKGIGKSTLLDRLHRHFSNLNVIRISIPQKIWQRKNLGSFFAKELGFEDTDNLKKNILEYNKKQTTDTIILIDDAQNLFLGKYGGFDAFREFVDLVNLKTDKLFWCSAFNEYSWAYIKGVMGSSQYLRTEVFLDGWSDECIKQLILTRHRLSDYKLSYDQIILASRSSTAQTEAVIEAEEQFFRLLWEQSNGNPRVALFLWINCLIPRGGHALRVSLPERPKLEKLGILDDNAWFVLAAIAKHENLTRNEAVSTTNLEWPQVAHAIKIGLENKLLHRSEGNRYRLHFSYQYDLIRQLKVKNFIYGID